MATSDLLNHSHNVCAGIGTCWCMATSDLLDHGHGVEEGGGMGQGLVVVVDNIIGCRGNCIRIYKLRQYNNIVASSCNH